MKTKILALLLTALMIISSFGVTVSAVVADGDHDHSASEAAEFIGETEDAYKPPFGGTITDPSHPWYSRPTPDTGVPATGIGFGGGVPYAGFVGGAYYPYPGGYYPYSGSYYPYGDSFCGIHYCSKINCTSCGGYHCPGCSHIAPVVSTPGTNCYKHPLIKVVYCYKCGVSHCPVCGCGSLIYKTYCTTHGQPYSYCAGCSSTHCPLDPCFGGKTPGVIAGSHFAPGYTGTGIPVYLGGVYYPGGGTSGPGCGMGFCAKHPTTKIAFCASCCAYHCPECIHYKGTTTYYCPIHKSQKISFCAYCGDYHCAKCGHNVTDVCQDHGNQKVLCPKCDYWHCPECPCVKYYGYNVTYYCLKHMAPKSFCPICQVLYCESCDKHTHPSQVKTPFGSTYGSYIYPYYTGFGSLGLGYGFSSYYGHVGYPFYNGVNFGYYIPGYGLTYYNGATEKLPTPSASIPSGTTVPYGTKLQLSCPTAGTSLFYTTDGTIPTAYSIPYKGPITLTADTVLKVIAVKPGASISPIAVLYYAVSNNTSYTDVAGYGNLNIILSRLVALGIFEDGAKFEPKGAVSYTDLADALTRVGIDMNAINVDIESFKDVDELSANDMVYILYKAFRTYELIASPKTDEATLEVLPYYANIKAAYIYKAAFLSFLENNALFSVTIDPAAGAERAYLAYAIGAVLGVNP